MSQTIERVRSPQTVKAERWTSQIRGMTNSADRVPRTPTITANRVAYTPFMSTGHGSAEDGATDRRLSDLLRTSETWSSDLRIPPMSKSTVAHARKILSFLDDKFKNDALRIFPSENAGVSIQRRGAKSTKVLEIDPDAVTGSVHDRVHRRHLHYALDDDRAAAAFLAAS